MAEQTDLQKDLAMLSAEIKRLEAEYTMFFAGRLPRPPWETRGRVEAMIKRHDRGHIVRTSDRFQFEMLQTRFQKMTEVWDRGLRARDRDLRHDRGGLRLVGAELRVVDLHDRGNLRVVVHQASRLLHADQPTHRGNSGLRQQHM